jgi:hypothetical protein
MGISVRFEKPEAGSQKPEANVDILNFKYFWLVLNLSLITLAYKATRGRSLELSQNPGLALRTPSRSNIPVKS